MAIFSIFGERITLIDVQPYDRNLSARVTKRIGSRDFATWSSDSIGAVGWDGFLLACNVRRSLVAPGRIGGQSIGAGGTFRVGNPSQDVGAGKKLDAWKGLSWQFAPVTVWLIEAGKPWSAAVQYFKGSIKAMIEQDGDLVFSFHDRWEDLRRDIQTSLYSGAGSWNGGAELANKPKPIGLGINRKVPAVPVDPFNGKFQVHHGAIEAVLEVEVKGGVIPSDVSNPPAAGKYYADLANGGVILGSSADGDVCVSFRGAKPDGTYTGKRGDLVRYVLGQYAGAADPAAFNTASFSAYNALDTAEVGIWIGTERRDIADAIDDLMAPVFGYVIPDLSDLWTIGRILAPTATSAATADLALSGYDVAAGSLKRIAGEEPPSQIRGNYKRYWMPREKDRLITTIDAAVAADLREPWRTVTAAGASLTEWPAAKPLTLDLYNDGSSAAQAEVNRIASMIGDRSRIYGWETGFEPLEKLLHSQLWIEHEDIDAGAGAAFRLLATDADLIAGTVQVEAWGLGA